MFGAIAGGIASALAGGAMSKLFGGGQKAASGGIQGDVLATDNNTVGMGDAGIKSAIQGSNVPNPDEAVPSFVSGAMAKAGKECRSEERFSRNAETDIYTLSLHDALPILVAPCLNCLEAVKKPPPVAFKVMCLLPITIL